MPPLAISFSQGFFWLMVLYFWLVSDTPAISLLTVSILYSGHCDRNYFYLCEKTSLFCDKYEWDLLLPLIKNSSNIFVTLLAAKKICLSTYTSWLSLEQFGSPVFDSSLVPAQGRGCGCLDRRQAGNYRAQPVTSLTALSPPPAHTLNKCMVTNTREATDGDRTSHCLD